MKNLFWGALVISLIFFSGCAKKKTEEEYLSLAREARSKNKLDEMLKYEKDLIKYYPKSEKILEYKKTYVEDLIKAAEIDTSEKRMLLYNEAIIIGDEIDKTKASLARLRLGVEIEKREPQKAKELFDKISQKDLETIASLELGEQKYEHALRCYSLLIDRYPQDTSAYKWYFMLGFIKSEYLQQPDEAKKYFKIVFERYPQSELADDAVFLYEHAGQNLEEIIFSRAKPEEKSAEKKKK